MQISDRRAVFFVCGLVLVSLVLLTPVTSMAASSSSFYYNFNTPGKLEEAGSLSQSSSPYWWINSGGRMSMDNGLGHTISGSLPPLDPWRLLYAVSSPADTDNGMHPQNLFRLVTKSTWENVTTQSYFKIDKYNFSASSNRNASNGLLLMSRYQNNGQTLYYAGLRVDGTAVIKKKLNGAYTTLAQKTLFAGSYNRDSAPTLIPGNKWIGLKSETITNADGSVSVKLYTDIGKTGVWKLVLSTTDKSSPIKSAGYAGLRTDFMDVSFEDFRLTAI